MKNHFELFAHGPSFDVDAFQRNTSLTVSHVWRRGDQRRYSCIESAHQTSGVSIELGDGRALSVPDQEQIAIDYLAAHRDELHALKSLPGVDTFILGLQYHLELDESVMGVALTTNAQLMAVALEIGVQPTFYVTFNRTVHL